MARIRVSTSISIMFAGAIVALLACTPASSSDSKAQPAEQDQAQTAAPAAPDASQGFHRSYWFQGEKAQQQLGLTPEQIQQLSALEDELWPRIQEIEKAKRYSYKAVIVLLDDHPDPPADQFEARRAALEKAWSDQAALSADKWLRMRKILTEEQWRNLPNAAPRALSLGQFAAIARGATHLGPKGQFHRPQLQRSGQAPDQGGDQPDQQ